MALRWPDKDPDEQLDYTVDWSRYLDTLTISSVEWRYVLTNDLGDKSKGEESVALSTSSNLDATDDESNPSGGLIVNSLPKTDTTATIVLSGGVANKDYVLICEITTSTSSKTSAAIVTKRTVNLRVRERN
jgi:hypothetical protein